MPHYDEARGLLNGVALQNATLVADATHAATIKTPPADLDEIPLADSAASFGLKKLTWANLKSTLSTWIKSNLISAAFTSLSIGTTVTPTVGVNAYCSISVFGNGTGDGSTAGPRGGFYNDASVVYMVLDSSVAVSGSGFLSGSDYFYIERTTSTGNTVIFNSGGGLTLNSTGNVVIKSATTFTSSGLSSTTVKASSAGGFISSDGSPGYTGTVTSASLTGKTITIKDGLIVGFA